jgi:hypothetical protein
MAKRNQMEEGAEAALPSTPSEKAAEFFAENPSYEPKSIFVTSDLVVFNGTVKGENHLNNYLALKKSEGITAQEFTKPTE